MNLNKIIKHLPRIIAAIILLETLLFKFGIGGEVFLSESKALFTQVAIFVLGHAESEGWFRVSTGVLELITSILLLWPRHAGIGAIMGVFLMMGAIISHVFIIGVIVGNDGGQLMMMALIVLMCCTKVMIDEKQQILNYFGK
ncbi:DoxX family protein [Reichenbachiella carrageenanivorans]|uniref:DoxX family protein n=1 Tax=Reichenbachiella carrageenanivorans TaxID=2979869 RepID=A0ABY6CYS3_9BACT|nr:DoxX family protein [Reichenbachiella carrageenanivorans]UXX78544.1 DoxX family protein [Reichenbachiella carrageenanivorans]